VAELVGAKARVQAVFGEPITCENLTVIPVARVRWGYGGGGGRAETPPSDPASGSGGGGSVAADPIGYLELGPEGAAFRPIRERRRAMVRTNRTCVRSARQESSARMP